MSDDRATDDEVSKAVSRLGDLYGQEVRTHGADPRSAGHKNREDQWLRFRKLAAVVEPAAPDAGMSVNDLGCGYGAMLEYFDGVGAKVDRYFGYDVSQDMLDIAQRQIGGPRVRLFNSPKVTESADYSFISGIFNVRLDATEDAWTDYIKETLLQVAAKSTRGMSFYLLSTYVDWKNERFYYGDPFMFFDFCKRNISKYVTLCHDYPLYEWTMTIRMEGGGK